MKYNIIEGPVLNDSVSRNVLCGTAFLISYTWIDSSGYLPFVLFDPKSNPLVIRIKIVPRFPMNPFFSLTKMPSGIFGVMTKLDRIGRKDFVDGNAQFIFCPVEIVS